MRPTILSIFLFLVFISGGCTTAAPAQATEPAPVATAESSIPAVVDPTAPLPPTFTATLPPADTATPEPAPTETLEPVPTATEQVLAEFRFSGNVRQLPDANAAIVASFSQGIHLRALNQDPSGQWYYVQIAPFSYGWVYQDEVTGNGLDALAQATPAATMTPEPQAPGGLKCFLSVSYTDAGKPRVFQLFMQGLTPINPYTYKLFNPKGGLMFAIDFKPKSDGTFYNELNADKAAPGTYSLEVIFAGEKATGCSVNLVQK